MKLNKTGEIMYQKKKIAAPDMFQLWNGLKEKEKFYLQDPVTQKSILAWDRLTEKTTEQLPFCFYTRRFSEKGSKNERWQKFLTEEIHFRYFILIEKQDCWLYYLRQEPQWQEVPYPQERPNYHSSNPNYAQWEEFFAAVQEGIAAGRVNKVVGAREVEIICRENINEAAVLARLAENNQNSYIFAYCKAEKTFLGATPELLVRKQQGKISSYALAGTIAKTGQGEEADFLQRDVKNNYEHQIVVEAICRKMKTVTPEVQVAETGILELKNLYHLKTDIVAEDAGLSLEQWAELLHPTPAMGGQPQKAALQLIEEAEKLDRGLYAAPLGYVDAQGEGIFVVGIRSALITGSKLYAYAGCGLVKQSDCRTEYEEIKSKLQTILETLGEKIDE